MKAIHAGLGILLDVCFTFSSRCTYPSENQVDQAASGIISSCEILADLLESIQEFVNRLKIYSQVSCTPAIDEMVVKLVVELISTLALVTRRLKQRRSRESLLVDGRVPYSGRRSQMGKELFCRQGYQGGPAEAGPSHARRGSDYGGSDSWACRWFRKEVRRG